MNSRKNLKQLDVDDAESTMQFTVVHQERSSTPKDSLERTIVAPCAVHKSKYKEEVYAKHGVPVLTADECEELTLAYMNDIDSPKSAIIQDLRDRLEKQSVILSQSQSQHQKFLQHVSELESENTDLKLQITKLKSQLVHSLVESIEIPTPKKDAQAQNPGARKVIHRNSFFAARNPGQPIMKSAASHRRSVSEDEKRHKRASSAEKPVVSRRPSTIPKNPGPGSKQKFFDEKKNAAPLAQKDALKVASREEIAPMGDLRLGGLVRDRISSPLSHPL